MDAGRIRVRGLVMCPIVCGGNRQMNNQPAVSCSSTTVYHNLLSSFSPQSTIYIQSILVIFSLDILYLFPPQTPCPSIPKTVFPVYLEIPSFLYSQSTSPVLIFSHPTPFSYLQPPYSPWPADNTKRFSLIALWTQTAFFIPEWWGNKIYLVL